MNAKEYLPFMQEMVLQHFQCLVCNDIFKFLFFFNFLFTNLSKAITIRKAKCLLRGF